MTTPTIAIVGRPNVGKSTLFNRLLKRRQAIVYEEAGTTRDRIYGEVEWDKRTFRIIDTGGLETAPVKEISRQIRSQVEIAIKEADGIVFVVDVNDGLVPQDYEVADILRKSGKPVFLAVNKVDSSKKEADSAAFYRLGLGEPVAISAYHGRGVDEVLINILNSFPDSSEVQPKREMLKLALVGRPNVGKSTLLNALTGKERALVESVPGTTRDPLDETINMPEGPVLLVDMAGIRRRGRIEEGIEKYSVLRAFDAINRADIVLLLIDGREGLTSQDEHIAGYVLDNYKGLLVLVNKADLLSKSEKTELSNIMLKRFKFLPEAPLLFISALYHKGINKIFPCARDIYAERIKIIPAENLNGIFREAVESHPPSGKGTRKLKLFSIYQSGTEPPCFIIESNDPRLVHFSYKRYIENILRHNFGFRGTVIKTIYKKRTGRQDERKKGVSAT